MRVTESQATRKRTRVRALALERERARSVGIYAQAGVEQYAHSEDATSGHTVTALTLRKLTMRRAAYPDT